MTKWPTGEGPPEYDAHPSLILTGLPKNKSILTIHHQLTFYFTRPIPGMWRRFWYWALLGWKWKKVEE